MAATPERPGSALDETGPAAPESWEPPSYRAKSHRRRNLTLVIVATVVVVLFALTGNLPGIPGVFFTSHPHLTNGLSFDSARPIADSMAEKVSGSSQLIQATGFANNRTYVVPLQTLTGSSCLLTDGNASRFVVPAEEGNLTLGLAAAWVFEYAQGPYVAFYVGVVNGSAVYYGQISHQAGNCIGVFQGPGLPLNVIDSTRATINATPDAAIFAQTYRVAMVVYAINEQTPNTSDFYFVWTLVYETCSFGVSGPGSGLFVGLNATTGANHGIYTGSLTTTVDCGLGGTGLYDPFP